MAHTLESKMAFPLIIPILPLLKVIALGSIKFIFIGVGAAFFPAFTLKFILGGAIGMVAPVIRWHAQQGMDDIEETLGDLDIVINHPYTKEEARAILLGMLKSTLVGMWQSTLDVLKAIVRLIQRAFNWFF